MKLKLHKIESSPWKAVNQLSKKYEKYTHEITRIVLSETSRLLGLRMSKAHEDAPLIFKGKIMYNPKSGQPIKIKDWKRLEEAIVKYLHIEKDFLQKKMVEDSFFLGSLIQRLEENQKESWSLDKFDLTDPDFAEFGYTDYDMDLLEAYKEGTGTYIQNVNDRERGKIQSIIIEGSKAHKSKGQIWQELWDSEISLNRDWDRVIVTEVAMASNNGLLISELRSTPEEENIFMKGVSAPDRCPACGRLIDGKVVVLVAEPPEEGDEVIVDGKSYTAIWPGKSNFGRNAKNYWAGITIHPYCRCSWSRWYLELEKYVS
ncbi:hypothetical protein LCGC14_0829040 [marine sediment metagenome]|uniref:Phage head morphogenesis domain-containing protein n=1 Tax=marine sediment metagenome TaxID=412755 RepID=A0A0F9S1E6_9ZZZZ